MDRIRLDKWLWAARFYKTRSLAVDEIGKGRVQVNGQPAKPAREVGPGDVISIRKEDPPIQVRVVAVINGCGNGHPPELKTPGFYRLTGGTPYCG